MSLTRRLQRIARAHLGALRGDPVEGSGEGSLGDGAISSERAEAQVPPDVAEAYRALEVPVGSDWETVKKGYRRVMKQYHQDRFDNDEEKREIAGTVSKRLNRAYQRIEDYLDDASS